MLLRLSFLAGICLTLVACSGNIKPEVPAEEYFRDGMAAMADERYLEAVRLFRELQNNYPFDKHISHASLELMAAYFALSDWGNAQAEADNFIRIAPNHEQVEFAWYIRARSLYEVDRSFGVNYRGADPAKYDIGAARIGIVAWQRFLIKFPSSIHAPEAQSYLLYYREVLARQELVVADFYLQKKAYLAAANRARFVVENYPTSGQNRAALEIMLTAYQALELLDLVRSTQAQLAAL